MSQLLISGICGMDKKMHDGTQFEMNKLSWAMVFDAFPRNALGPNP